MEGEREIIGVLEKEGSMASGVFCTLRLTRASVKEVLRWLQGRRQEQVALARVLCATRFKSFNKEGNLEAVACPRGCGNIDTLEHMLECNGLLVPKETAPIEDWLTLLWKMAKVAKLGDKAIPLPWQSRSPVGDGEDEISLNVNEEEEEIVEGSSCEQMSLDFDICERSEPAETVGGTTYVDD